MTNYACQRRVRSFVSRDNCSYAASLPRRIELDKVTPEDAAKLIHRILCSLVPVGRMIMLRTVSREYYLDQKGDEGFMEGLEIGRTAGWFAVHGEGIQRKK